MPLWSKIALTVAGVLICALWVAIVWQQRAIAELTAAIAASSATGKATKITSDNLDALPPPVARYLKHVLPSHLPMIRLARYRQIGNLRTDVRSSHWMEFEASQIIAPPSTAFLKTKWGQA